MRFKRAENPIKYGSIVFRNFFLSSSKNLSHFKLFYCFLLFFSSLSFVKHKKNFLLVRYEIIQWALKQKKKNIFMSFIILLLALFCSPHWMKKIIFMCNFLRKWWFCIIDALCLEGIFGDVRDISFEWSSFFVDKLEFLNGL